MISCPECEKLYNSVNTSCPHCNYKPIYIHKFKAWAPKLAESGGGFSPNSFKKLYENESTNFWFKSRNKVITWALQKHTPNCQSFLEVGCGTGYVLNAVSKAIPKAKIIGSEIFTEGLLHASKRLPHVELVQMDARNSPYREEFDVISAFDVIEHIKEDSLVLKNMHQALKENGHIYITVPQHKWLWSSADEEACHVRRYTKQEIHEVIKNSGFSIIRSTSFVSLLLPLMLVSRYETKNKKSKSELSLNPVVNYLLEKIMSIEFYFIKLGLNFPIGGSRIIIASKKDL